MESTVVPYNNDKNYKRNKLHEIHNTAVGTDTAFRLYYITMAHKQCVRCGVHLTEDRALRCKKCRERVDEEFR